MNRDEVIRRLAEGRPSLAPFGVASLFLFGSVARGEESANSDVDLLVEFERPVSLIAFARLRRVLSGLLWLQSRPGHARSPEASTSRRDSRRGRSCRVGTFDSGSRTCAMR